jgi:neopullulanase
MPIPMIRRLVVFLVLSTAALFGTPTVRKVDPPNWYLGRGNPMLLLYGEDLANALVTTTSTSARIRRTEASANGHYLFVWLEITAAAKPGNVPLAIKSPQGDTTVQFPLANHRAINDGMAGLAANDVIYLLMPDRFADGDPANNDPAISKGNYHRTKPKAYHGGDLKGVREHLAYFKDLGVTTLWMTPFVDNDNTPGYDGYHGYGAIDLYGVEEHYGTLDDVKALVADAHRQGIKVVFDWVANHTGAHHPWVNDPPTPTWFHGSVQKHQSPSYEFPPITDMHALPSEQDHIRNGWFADILADLNQDDPRVAEYLTENAMWWVEQTGIDAYRLDTFPYVPRSFWAAWHKSLHDVFPRLDTIGENYNGDPAVVSFFLGGRSTQGYDTGLNTAFDFPLMYAIRDVIAKHAPATKITDVLRRDWLYPHPERLVTFLGNHDMDRILTEAGGDRQVLKNAFSLLLTERGIPQLYYGDEIGMTGGADPDNRRDFAGGFPGDTNNAFTQSGRTPEQEEVFAHVQKVLKLRREHPALTSGKLWNLFADESAYAYLRDGGADRVLVGFNNGDAVRTLKLNGAQVPFQSVASFELLDGDGTASRTADEISVEIAPHSVTLWLVR